MAQGNRVQMHDYTSSGAQTFLQGPTCSSLCIHNICVSVCTVCVVF